ncbi:uncharacterized protein LOC127867998 [Dreissena polymorpha]|uniref:EF-hand domain-containing protein n=1 Tax=Dreissena polymorpha TaxID=45954 RepID=A0A9D4N9F2_DREPO|nr:uncharacterized protein LOC127867998 [Dreissena polymorpha]KAH3889122.1 hypothetical protein DPMN_013172 [Dreissena polymorpha]
MTMYVLSLAFFIACVYCQRNRVDLNFEDGRLDAGWRRRLSGGRSLGVTGHVDREGNWGIGASFTFGRKRRSAEQMKLFTLSLEVDKCNFNLYDVDRDDLITKEELVAVFGDNKNTTELFEALDMLSGDGTVNREEFLYVMHRTVEGC